MSGCGYAHRIEVPLMASGIVRHKQAVVYHLIWAQELNSGSSEEKQMLLTTHLAIFLTPPHNFNYEWWSKKEVIFTLEQNHDDLQSCMLLVPACDNSGKAAGLYKMILSSFPMLKREEHIQYYIQVVIYVNLWPLEYLFQICFKFCLLLAMLNSEWSMLFLWLSVLNFMRRITRYTICNEWT